MTALFKFTGKLRKIAPRETVPFRWPATRKLQYEYFDTWYYVARQVVAAERISAALADGIFDVVFWKDGTVRAKNKRLARLCGGCSTKTVTRHIERYARLGLLAVEYGKPRRVGGLVGGETRTIRLTLPAVFDQRQSVQSAASNLKSVLYGRHDEPDIVPRPTVKCLPPSPDGLIYESTLQCPPF